jgi:molybdopterin molybdotransferase
MKALIAVTEARQRILEFPRKIVAETLALEDAQGRILAESILASHDAPPFVRSAMDGYAVSEIQERAELEIVQEGGILSKGSAVRVVTGGLLPPGTQAVIPQEWGTLAGNRLTYERRLSATFIRQQGEDVRAGALLMKAGTGLGAVELAILAEFGITQVRVARIPRVAHLVTGEELVDPAEQLSAGKIRDSNSTLLAGLIREAGAERVDWARVGDGKEEQRAVLARPSFQEADVIFISGGASVGPRDHSRGLMEEMEWSIVFHGVNVRPGKPLLYAESPTGRAAFVLPGNPVSHWVVWQLFIRPLLQYGTSERVVFLPLSVDWKIRGGDGRAVYWPGRTVVHGNQWVVEPLPLMSSGSLARLAGANCLIEPEKECWQVQELVKCWIG